ncbi:hypothetical protein CWR48_11920 [Oceanobacillus arenosus]|uniref:Spore coat protein CotO n=1 Tax=Oceanobacillus arenosus TaxID=1229153 RepID=A0A3D8PQN5_9BACI|nr:CotO family spore coat protein [Oceanobacillus arenosus]RDW18284.1 hypothetical protein CWR48_11920 [Oceanobacillus arenosus]
MSDKKFANEPMLYIQQPSISRPAAPMQHQYTSPKRRKDVISSESTADTQLKSAAAPRKRVKHNTFQQQLMGKTVDNLEETIDQEPVQEKVDEVKEQATQNRKKQFKEMTLQEKALYLADSPTFAPKVKCEVKTNEQSHRGIVTDFKDDTVFMQVGRRTTLTSIPFADITEIRMISF